MILPSLWLTILVLFSACTAPASEMQVAADGHQEEEHAHAGLPELSPVSLGEDEKLRVVATTSILADVVKNVGGVPILLTTLLPLGADPHSYNATPEDLRKLSDAHVVFMVGEGVEESMLSVLANREGSSALIAVNTGIDLLTADEEAQSEDAHDHHGSDPHTWMAVPNVIHWTEIIAQSLRTLDPANAETYTTNAATYTAELEMLDAEIQTAAAALPTESRKLVTDHESFGHFAARYGFTIIGSVIPSLSTLSSPTAQEVAALQQQIMEEGVEVIFVGSTTNPDLAEQIATDLGIRLVPLYAESLSAADGPAPTYIELMRYDIAAIVGAAR
jgi:ABC-type Zn uptake system ZnuABC Zn-binding protein ZnuA